MTIRAILETETMDPDFKEPFLNGMPFDISELLNTCNYTTQMRVLIPVPISSITFINQYQNTLKKALKERIKGTLDGLSKEQRAELLNEVLNETLNEGSLNDD